MSPSLVRSVGNCWTRGDRRTVRVGRMPGRVNKQVNQHTNSKTTNKANKKVANSNGETNWCKGVVMQH